MTSRRTPGGSVRTSSEIGRRELIVSTANSGVQVSTTSAWSEQVMDLAPPAELAAAPDIVFRRVFGSADRLRAVMNAPEAETLVADLSVATTWRLRTSA